MRNKIINCIQRGIQALYGRIYNRLLEADHDQLDELKLAVASIPKLEEKVQQLGQKLRCTTAISANRKIGAALEPRGNSAEWRHEELFILGSGASMLDLSPTERTALQSGATVAMNKYLLYWDLIGIWPTYTFLADIHSPASEVLTRKVEIAACSDLAVPQFILTCEYQDWPLAAWSPIYFKRPQDFGDHPWAHSADEPMYFHRGSLTCLLNLITVHRLAPKVTLLGVDLDQGQSFFQGAYDKDVSLHDHWESMRKSTGVHPTALPHENYPPIQERLPWVFERMKEAGVEVFVYNPNSLLSKLGICQVRERLN